MGLEVLGRASESSSPRGFVVRWDGVGEVVAYLCGRLRGVFEVPFGPEVAGAAAADLRGRFGGHGGGERVSLRVALLLWMRERELGWWLHWSLSYLRRLARVARSGRGQSILR